MKKLKLQALKLGAKELLTREQLKNLMGGSGGSGNKCNVSCSSDSDCDSVCPNCEKNTNWGDNYYCYK